MMEDASEAGSVQPPSANILARVPGSMQIGRFASVWSTPGDSQRNAVMK